MSEITNVVTQQLSKTCTACGALRKTKAIVYDPGSLLPYCQNHYFCNERHPNSPTNLIRRGAELKLVRYQEAERLYKEHLIKEHTNPDMVNEIREMIGKPKMMRFYDPDMCEFLVKLKKIKGYESLVDTVRFCIREVMEAREEYAVKTRTAFEEKQDKEDFEAAVTYVQQPTPKPKPQQEDEDEIITI